MSGSELLRIGIDGVVPVRWEAEKADAENGMLVGWASVYNVIDQQDDVVVPGAFRKSMGEWRAAGGSRVIGLTLDHQNTAEGLIGALAKVDDTAYGLKTGFRFSSVRKAQDARAKAREGILNGLSIYGPIFKKAFDTVQGKSVRILQEVGLDFVGLTPMPANTDALVLKAAAEVVEQSGAEPGEADRELITLSDSWVTDMRSALAISVPAARDIAVGLLVKSQYGAVLAPPAETGDGGDTNEDQGDGDADTAAAKYALGVIGESEPGADPLGGEPGMDPLDGLFASIDAAKTKSELEALEADLKKASES